MAITWKLAAAGGATLGLGIGGFVLDDRSSTAFEPIRDVDLQSARDSISSLSSPIRVAPPTTVQEASTSPVAVAPAPAPPAVAADSASSPVPAPPAPTPAPAPAPTFDDSASPVQPPQGGGDDSASAGGSSS